MQRAADFAGKACVPLIEAKAPIDYDWLSRPFGGMFTQAEAPGPDGIVRYRGDAIRILVQGQWLRHAYECAFDPATGKIVSVQIRPGRLVPPTPIAQATGSSVGQPASTTTPAEAQKLIQQALQKAAAQQPGKQPLPAAKPRPHYGEPGPISIQQAHLKTAQVDAPVSIAQVSRGPAAASISQGRRLKRKRIEPKR